MENLRTIFGKVVPGGTIKVQRFFKDDIMRWVGKEVEISRVSSSKTGRQVRYAWGVVFKCIADHTGFTSDEVYEVYRNKYLTYHKEHKGKVYSFSKGISALTKEEMAEFITRVVEHARAELSVEIPSPDSEKIYE